MFIKQSYQADLTKYDSDPKQRISHHVWSNGNGFVLGGREHSMRTKRQCMWRGFSARTSYKRWKPTQFNTVGQRQHSYTSHPRWGKCQRDDLSSSRTRALANQTWNLLPRTADSKDLFHSIEEGRTVYGVCFIASSERDCTNAGDWINTLLASFNDGEKEKIITNSAR